MLKKLIDEQNYQKQRISGSLMTILVVVVAILSVVRVFLANWQVESSEILRDLDKKIAEQSTANQALAEKLREKESLIAIENQAKALGYNRNMKLTFLTNEANIAANFQGESLVR